MKVDQLEAFLRNSSCFAVLSEGQLDSLAGRAEIRSYKLGEVVFRQGDRGDRMYVVYSGKVRVLREVDGVETPLNSIFPGEHFGELALVHDRPRNATIRAAADSTLIAISADAVDALLRENADLKRYFERYAERVELWNFIKMVGHIGKELKPASLRSLVDQFQEELIAAGGTILAQGAVPESFSLIHAGRVKILRDGELQATLTAGDTFGGGSLIEDPATPSRFAVVADSAVQVLKLAAPHFRKLLSDVPALRSFFQEQIAHYRADEAAEHFRALGLPADEDSRATKLSSAPSAVVTSDAKAAVTSSAESAPQVPVATKSVVEPIPLVEPKPRTWWSPLSDRIARWRFVYIPQHDMSDCGAACLAMITAHYGRTVGVSRLRDLAGVTPEGASLTQLDHAAGEIGYDTRSLEISANRLNRLKLPVILFWKGYHYVVLYALDDKHAWIADPAFGKMRVTRAELAANYSGFALEVQPTDASQAVRARSHAADRVRRLLLQNKKSLAIILGSSLLLDLFGLTPALFTQWIVDSITGGANGGPPTMFQLFAVGMLLVSLCQIGMTALRGMVAVLLSQKLDRTLLQEFYAHLLTLPTRFFKLRRTGDIIARFEDNQHVRALFTAGTVTAILDLLMVVVYFCVMFYWNVKLALVVLAFLPLFAGFTLFVSPIMKRQHRRLLEEQAAHESNLIESIGGIDMVKAMAVERPVRLKWEKLFNQFLSSQLQNEKLGQTFGAVGSALGVLSTVALLWYGAVLVIRGELSVGEFMAFNMLAGQVTGPLAGIIGLWDQIQQARVSLERLSDVLDNDPEPQPTADERVYPERIRGAVRFEGVYFNYGSKQAPNILRGVSFEAHPGQRIAIVGRSGSGKTTLARIILGLYRPTEGRVTIDGWDLKRIDLGTFRRQVGIVLQENLLFSGTIRENIALGDPEPDLNRVQEAATLAGAHEFISAMPLKYETVVGELGLTLSGGQRQRISIARALYRDPRILVLDEATSALDSFSEREIQKNLDAILSDRTAFIIAHKIATVRSADNILVLHDGAIVEQGTHEELIEKKGTYYFLAAQQLNL